MDYRQLQDILTTDIELLENLRDKLSDSGDSLSIADKQLLRHQLSCNWLKKMQEEQQYFFSAGHATDFGQSNYQVLVILRDLS